MTTIVMLHGAFCGGWAFEDFRVPFEAAGWRVVTPDLRGHGPDDPHNAVNGVSMSDYADDVVALCKALPEPPVLLGHSLGGLVAQMAARRLELEALVLLAPSPPWGVQGWSFEEAAIAFGVQAMGAFSGGVLAPDAGLMRLHGLHEMAAPEREAALARMRPESGRAVREALNWWLDPFMTTSVGPGPLKGPALAMVGSRDVVNPPATVGQVATRIGAELKTVPGMNHWMHAEPGWEAVAGTVLTWLRQEVTAAA